MAVYRELAILLRQLPRSALERIGIPETLSCLVDIHLVMMIYSSHGSTL